MKILITGASGQLGKALISEAPKSFEIIKADRKNLDLADPHACYSFVLENKPDWIINCGAYTQVDQAEIEKEISFKVNADAPFAFAKALKEVGGKILQISTDYVFGGKQNIPYTPDSEKDPINIYGSSKSLAEDRIENILFKNNQAIILRTSWLIGPHNDNFLLKILNLHQNKKSIDVVFDQISSPTSTLSLANVCWRIIFLNVHDPQVIKYPILHWSDSGIASWYDIAFYIGELGLELGLITKKAEIKPVTSEQYITKANRPNYSVLNSLATSSLLGMPSIHWQLEIKRIFNRINKIKDN